jgi:ubiquinone/menaquinone biosynthesis C-methylase UbiE
MRNNLPMATETPVDQSGNAEAIEAWDGPLYERFVRFRTVLTEGLGAHGAEAIRLAVPAPGERVLDIGCGFGVTTRELADLVGPRGEAVGLDAAPRFIETASAEAAQDGVANARFAVSDVQSTPIEGQFDLAFSQMGTMFFANPVAALRNVRRALVPGGRLVMVVWRSKIENRWAYDSQLITERFVSKPEDYDEPTCGPGPFSMADADTTSGILLSAGFREVTLRRCDLPIAVGADIDEAVDFVMSIGPAGEILRLAGERADHLRPAVADSLREHFEAQQSEQGVNALASTWIVSARAPSPGEEAPGR